MGSYVPPNQRLGIALLEALGVPYENVSRLELTIDVHEAPTLVIHRFIMPSEYQRAESVVERFAFDVVERSVLSREPLLPDPPSNPKLRQEV